jgi:tetratricopeptide (TPR) repeat protein
MRSPPITPRLAILMGVCLLAPLAARGHEDVDVQIAALTARIQREPRNAELYFARGELLRARRQWDAALANYDRSAELNPRLTATDLARGLLWLEAGRPAAAVAALDRFLAGHPEHAAAHRARARALAQCGQRTAAAADLTRAIALEPNPQPEHYLEQARVLAANSDGEVDTALRALDTGMAKLGPLVTLQLYAIELELQKKRYDAALARLETIAAQSPRKEMWLARRAEILEQAGRRAARAAYLTALAQLDALPAAIRAAGAMAALRTRVCAGLVRVGKGETDRCGFSTEVSRAPH